MGKNDLGMITGVSVIGLAVGVHVGTLAGQGVGFVLVLGALVGFLVFGAFVLVRRKDGQNGAPFCSRIW